MRRRDFLERSCKLAGGTVLAALSHNGCLWASPLPKKLLVIGGTDFLGPAVVEAGLIAGYHVTLFNRGVTNPGLFPYLEHLHGFRSIDEKDQNFTALSGRVWDAAIDVWPSDPVMVASLAEFLKDRVKHYLYVSSGAAYRNWPAEPGIREDAPLREFHGGVPNYSDGKAESERRLTQLLGPALTIVRPGAIDGYRNDGFNLQTWLVRTQTGGRHIGPGSGMERIQVVDVKDVARFLILCIEQSLFGAFNVTGESLTFGSFLEACKLAAGPNSEFVWIPEKFLQEQDPDFRRFFPLWTSESSPQGAFQISSEKALRAGLKRRPFQETAMDVLEWGAERDLSVPSTAGPAGHWFDPLTASKEAEIIRNFESLKPSSHPGDMLF